MWLVICAQIRTGAEPSPRSTTYIRVVASSGSIHLPLDVATVGNSNPTRLENTQQNVTQNMSEGFRSWLWSLRNRLKCDNIVYRLSNRVSRKCAAILLNSRVNKFHYLFVKLPRGSLVTRANRPHSLLLSPLRVVAFCIYRIHFYLQHERNYCLSAPAAASAEQLSNELSATATLHTVNQVGIVLGDRFSLQLGTQSHRWYLLKIFQMWNWSRPAVSSHSPLSSSPRFAICLWFDFQFGHLINSKMRTSVYIAHIGSEKGRRLRFMIAFRLQYLQLSLPNHKASIIIQFIATLGMGGLSWGYSLGPHVQYLHIGFEANIYEISYMSDNLGAVRCSVTLYRFFWLKN